VAVTGSGRESVVAATEPLPGKLLGLATTKPVGCCSVAVVVTAFVVVAVVSLSLRSLPASVVVAESAVVVVVVVHRLQDVGLLSSADEHVAATIHRHKLNSALYPSGVGMGTGVKAGCVQRCHNVGLLSSVDDHAAVAIYTDTNSTQPSIPPG